MVGVAQLKIIYEMESCISIYQLHFKVLIFHRQKGFLLCVSYSLPIKNHKMSLKVDQEKSRETINRTDVLPGSLGSGLARFLIRCKRVIYLCQEPVYDTSVKCDEQIETVIMYNYQKCLDGCELQYTYRMK